MALIAQGVGFYPLAVVYFAAATLLALVVHEYAHALAAARLGDPTPKGFGRLSLNPRRHFDPFGTGVFPAILLLRILFLSIGVIFAYAKPMPYNSFYLKNETRDTVLIQVAGPAANLLLAIAFGILLTAFCGASQIQDFLYAGLLVNVLFTSLHIVPIPPLDCARAITPFLGPQARNVMENLQQYAPLFMLLVFFILGNFFFGFVGAITSGLLELLPGQDCIVRQLGG